MKVLYVCNRGEIGGATRALQNILLNNAYEKVVITPVNGVMKKYCLDHNIECHVIKYYEIGYAFNDIDFKKVIKFILLPIFFILNLIVNNINLRKINKVIDMKTIDFIHTNTNRDNFGIQLSNYYNIKHIMHLREFDKEFFSLIYLKKNIYNYFNYNTCCFISVSDAIKNNYIKKGLSNIKIHTIYDGIECNKLKYNKPIFKEKYNIIMLSNICENKGQIQLVNALKKLDKEYLKYFHVDFYGTGSTKYIKYIKEKIQEYKLSNIIEFKGYCNDVYSQLAKYDIGIMASKNEGFGLVTVEYMLSGIVVIASKSGANLEIIEDNCNGLLYEYNNTDDLKNKLVDIITKKVDIEKISENANYKSRKKYDIDISNKDLFNLYLSMKER